MREFIIHFKKLDWVLIVSILLLVGIGLLSIYSSSLGGENFLNFKKQLIFASIGLFLMFLLSFFDWRILRDSYLVFGLYVASLLLLAGLYFFAPEIRGIKSWYKLGPVLVEPIEFAKLTLLLLLAKYFSMRHIEVYRIRHIFLSGFYIFLPTALIFFQPDLGPALILLALWFGILLISGIKLKHFLILIFCLVLVFVFSWFTILKEYQKSRILSFLNPIDPLGLSWNQNQSKIAIGSGGIFGQGLVKGSQTQYGFLPASQTDFIFAAIAEEFGFLGVSVLLFLFLLLLWRVIKIALLATSNFPRLFAAGLSIILFSQAFIHIGMNLGILPIIGISLPLVSYGGSNLLTTLIGLGILQSIKSR